MTTYIYIYIYIYILNIFIKYDVFMINLMYLSNSLKSVTKKIDIVLR